MIATWVLIISLSYTPNGGQELLSQEFNSKESCLYAGEAIRTAHNWSTRDLVFVCVEK